MISKAPTTTQESTNLPRPMNLGMILVLVVLVCLFFIPLGESNPESIDMHRQKSTPDLTSDLATDPIGAIASARAGLTWLKLVGAPIKVPSTLAFAGVFKEPSPTPNLFMDALADELERQAVPSYAFESDGWRGRDDPKLKQIPYPTNELLMKALDGKSAVWIQVGWYKEVDNTYQRLGERWVTVVGFLDENLTVFDPHPQSGEDKQAHNLKMVKLPPSSELIGEDPELPLKGFKQKQLLGSIHPVEGADTAIIDSLVVLWYPDAPDK